LSYLQNHHFLINRGVFVHCYRAPFQNGFVQNIMTNFLKKYVSSIFIFSMCVKSELNLRWMLHFHRMHKLIFQRLNWGVWRVSCYKMLGARSVQRPRILKLPYWTSISKSYNPSFHRIYVIITSKHHRFFGKRSFLTMKVFTPKFKKIKCYLGIFTIFRSDFYTKLTIHGSILTHRFKSMSKL
jgi:hypothetical protein